MSNNYEIQIAGDEVQLVVQNDHATAVQKFKTAELALARVQMIEQFLKQLDAQGARAA